MSHWLTIIGVGEHGIAALPEHLRVEVATADVLIGPPRFLPQQSTTQELIAWQAPLARMLEQVEALKGRKTVLLATGDPSWFGIGATLSRHLAAEDFFIHPAPSAFQLAAARLQWPLQNTATISLHGRAVEMLHPHLQPRQRILALTSNAATLTAVTELLTARGFGQSQLHVLASLGGPDEQVTSFPANEGNARQIGDFYTLAIDCVADPDIEVLSITPGLPDSVFASNGQLTKRDVRATTLAKLAPFHGGLLWDVGAGSGSVGIEWMRAARGAEAICFERDIDRLKMIDENRQNLGVPNLAIVPGDLPATLVDQPAPDAIFIGGAVANEAVFAACWQALKPGGTLVANSVTLEGEQALFTRQSTHGGDLTRIEISVLDKVGDYRTLRPRMAVTQWHVRKAYNS